MAKHNSDGAINVLLGLTGSVATIKARQLVDKLITNSSQLPLNVCLVSTQNALHFVDGPEAFQREFNKQMPQLKERLEFIRGGSERGQSGAVLAFTDADEWTSWHKRDDPVLHIELRKWAHVLLVAPLDANTLAKLSHGMCDNLLTSVARAWDTSTESMKRRPVVICPAMNTFMYENPLTAQQLDILERQFSYVHVASVAKKLMCGDTGMGAMAEVDSIVEAVVKLIQERVLS